MVEHRLVEVEIVYALPDEQTIITLSVPAGTTVEQALARSGVMERYRLEMGNTAVGIFGKRVAGDTVLNARDRIEIYRPLVADPKQARRRRAAHNRR